MAIYCYKCHDCGKVYEYLSPSMSAPGNIPHRCGPADGQSKLIDRHYASELPAAHTQGDYHFSPHFDAGAGRTFATKAEYVAWQKANTGSDGAVPEPLQGKRKTAYYEEAAHACHINQQVQIDEKAQRDALGKLYDATHHELAGREAMGLKAPSLDD